MSDESQLFLKEVILGDYAYIKARIGWKGLSRKEYIQKGGALLGAGNHIENGRFNWTRCDRISLERYEESPEIALQENDVVISKDGTIGRVAYIEKLPAIATINGTMMLIRSKRKELEPLFLYHYLLGEKFQSLIREKVSGSSVPHIFQRDMVGLKMNIPPLPEQKRIAEILSGIDKLILDINKVIDKLNLLKISITKRLMKKGINNDKFKNTSLGCIPDSWKLVKGIDCLSLGSGISPSSIKFSKQGEILYMKVDDFNNPENNVHIKTTKLRLKNSDNPKVRPYPKGTVVIAKRGAAIQQNRVRLLTQKTYVDTNLMTIIPNGFLSEFFAIYLKNENINSLADATSVPQINNFHLNDYIFAMPPINEQKQIVQVLGSISNKIELNIKKLSFAKSLKQSLMQDLLSGRLRVNI